VCLHADVNNTVGLGKICDHVLLLGQEVLCPQCRADEFVRQRVFTASMSNVKSEQESKRNDFVGIPRHRERLGDDTSAIVLHNIRSNSDLHERWFLR